MIGKAKRPHSFPKYSSDLEQHITYRHNKRGWMTTDIFIEFLNSLNNKMKRQNRHILMFLENCPLHPHINLSNIELRFYPKNTTAKLQAMDLGVIANLKKRYSKRTLNHARAKVRDVTNVAEFVKDIQIFDAILSAKVAWESVPPTTIAKCFRKSGITKDSVEILAEPIDDEEDDSQFRKEFEESTIKLRICIKNKKYCCVFYTSIAFPIKHGKSDQNSNYRHHCFVRPPALSGQFPL